MDKAFRLKLVAVGIVAVIATILLYPSSISPIYADAVRVSVNYSPVIVYGSPLTNVDYNVFASAHVIKYFKFTEIECNKTNERYSYIDSHMREFLQAIANQINVTVSMHILMTNETGHVILDLSQTMDDLSNRWLDTNYSSSDLLLNEELHVMVSIGISVQFIWGGTHYTLERTLSKSATIRVLTEVEPMQLI
jgi:hypothetical protein